MSGSNAIDGIAPYLSRYAALGEDGKAYGGYGPRLFGETGGVTQFARVMNLLRKKPASRQAVIQLFDRDDIVEDHEDVPCTCTMQFLIRGGGLTLVTYMRSNDAYVGLPHDVFSFTMLQELAARTLDVPLGPYVHMVGSLHLYETDVSQADAFLAEGWQGTQSVMPAMPEGDPWPGVHELVAIDAQLRANIDPLQIRLPDDAYWADLSRVLIVFFLFKQSRRREALEVVDGFVADAYKLAAHEKLDQIR